MKTVIKQGTELKIGDKITQVLVNIPMTVKSIDSKYVETEYDDKDFTSGLWDLSEPNTFLVDVFEDKAQENETPFCQEFLNAYYSNNTPAEVIFNVEFAKFEMQMLERLTQQYVEDMSIGFDFNLARPSGTPCSIKRLSTTITIKYVELKQGDTIVSWNTQDITVERPTVPLTVYKVRYKWDESIWFYTTYEKQANSDHYIIEDIRTVYLPNVFNRSQELLALGILTNGWDTDRTYKHTALYSLVSELVINLHKYLSLSTLDTIAQEINKKKPLYADGYICSELQKIIRSLPDEPISPLLRRAFYTIVQDIKIKEMTV